MSATYDQVMSDVLGLLDQLSDAPGGPEIRPVPERFRAPLERPLDPPQIGPLEAGPATRTAGVLQPRRAAHGHLLRPAMDRLAVDAVQVKNEEWTVLTGTLMSVEPAAGTVTSFTNCAQLQGTGTGVRVAVGGTFVAVLVGMGEMVGSGRVGVHTTTGGPEGSRSIAPCILATDAPTERTTSRSWSAPHPPSLRMPRRGSRSLHSMTIAVAVRGASTASRSREPMRSP